jgi:hypothetical protein
MSFILFLDFLIWHKWLFQKPIKTVVGAERILLKLKITSYKTLGSLPP